MVGFDTAAGASTRRTAAWRPGASKRTLQNSTAATDFGNLDSRGLASLFVFCTAAYIGIYAFEAPLRYVLYLCGKDNYIFLRDALILGPLAVLLAAQALRLRIHPAYFVFGALIVFHGLVLMGTIGDAIAVAYAMKIVANVLCGFFLASLLVSPGKKLLTFMVVIWCVALIGLCLDKFFVTFPWTGIKTIIGNLNVDVSKNWEIQDPLARRVAGFARSSISAAILVPLLGIVIMSHVRTWRLRVVVGAASCAAVFLTTQKGSILALIPVLAILCLPPSRRPALLRFCCIVFMVACVALPLVTLGLYFAHGTGVFSTQSIFLRIADTWPDAWQWILHHQMLVFGVGLGGIGGPQRLYAINSFNPADNFFILMYAYFGAFAVLYLLFICGLVLRPVIGSKERATAATAVLAFLLGYGTVLSLVEDQLAALFLGAAIGALWRETHRSLRVGVRAAAFAT
ncbi:MAG: hypothetical protein KGQ82_05530 [Alphaproteobacteria bacterium]|nr:hypothetical protein [Alphaproteobacteria bacterium]